MKRRRNIMTPAKKKAQLAEREAAAKAASVSAYLTPSPDRSQRQYSNFNARDYEVEFHSTQDTQLPETPVRIQVQAKHGQHFNIEHLRRLNRVLRFCMERRHDVRIHAPGHVYEYYMRPLRVLDISERFQSLTFVADDFRQVSTREQQEPVAHSDATNRDFTAMLEAIGMSNEEDVRRAVIDYAAPTTPLPSIREQQRLSDDLLGDSVDYDWDEEDEDEDTWGYRNPNTDTDEDDGEIDDEEDGWADPAEEILLDELQGLTKMQLVSRLVQTGAYSYAQARELRRVELITQIVENS